MELQTATLPWDFSLLDSGQNHRLERWGNVVLVRPDPQAIWSTHLPHTEWDKADAVFKTGNANQAGKWIINNPLPHPWVIKFENLKFLLKLTPFKHTGIFPEQAVHWEWFNQALASGGQPLKILNLFAYTGASTMVLAKLGHQITHVDASKPALAWAKENQKLNLLPENSVRWILDDAIKFVKREIKRGAQYDGIIMDPPAFGHGPSGKTWKFNDDLPALLADCVSLLSSKAKFLLVNGYATNSSAIALNNLLEDSCSNLHGQLEYGELCLKQKDSRLLSMGIFAKWLSN